MSAVVVDASIAIKWVIAETGTAEALSLRQRPLLAPDLLMAECANILWKKVRRGELTADEAGWAARLLARADVDLLPMRSFLYIATQMAIMLDHPAYDCLYLAVAEAERALFVTADETLLRKLAQEPTGRFADRAISIDRIER
jgi:predicted nucleic acid-binding protein